MFMKTSSIWDNDQANLKLGRDVGVVYKTNGTGRDTYIYNDNGGFSSMHQATVCDKPGSFLPSVTRRYGDRKPVVQSKSIVYRQDGTGRDSYIIIILYRYDNGGYFNPNKIQEFREAFKSTLRTYERNPNYLETRKQSLIRKQKKNYLSFIGDQQISPMRSVSRNEEPLIQNNDQSSTMFKNNNFSTCKNQQSGSPQQTQSPCFTTSRNTINAVKLLTDNPKADLMRILKNYQRNLDVRLSKPRVRDDSLENSQSPQRSQDRTPSKVSIKSNLFMQKQTVPDKQKLFKSFIQQVHNPIDNFNNESKLSTFKLNNQQRSNESLSPLRVVQQ